MSRETIAVIISVISAVIAVYSWLKMKRMEFRFVELVQALKDEMDRMEEEDA